MTSGLAGRVLKVGKTPSPSMRWSEIRNSSRVGSQAPKCAASV